LLSPLLIGIAAGRQITSATPALMIAALAVFLLRQPATIFVKIYAGRRLRNDLAAACFWFAAYGLIALLAWLVLIRLGHGYVTFLAVPALPIFAWHLWLVSRRAERGQVELELLGSGVLALAAPAGFWVGRGAYHPEGWWLWALTWGQSAASIVYAYLRLEQRKQNVIPDRRERWRQGGGAMAFTSFNLLTVAVLSATGLLPRWLFLPYLLQEVETIWGIERPAIGWQPTHIGVRQLIVSIGWTILFLITWQG